MIILGLIAGAALGGFWGVVLTVPVMATVKIITGHFWRTRVLGQPWEEATADFFVDHSTQETLLGRIRARDEPDEAAEPEE